MASSDNLVTMEPWVLRTTFGDSWLADMLSRETETISKALQKSFSSQIDNVSSDLITTTSVQTPTPTVSNGSENDNVVVSKRRNAVAGVTTTTTGGKITKRKSRASKRATTTFITADPANFRQMVQQVTGVRLNGSGQLEVAPLLKPEPQRLVNRLQQQTGGGGFLPTLDTSAFFLDPSHQNYHHHQIVSPGSTLYSQPASVSVSPPSLLAAVGGSAASAFDFDSDSFSGFPTLESWKV